MCGTWRLIVYGHRVSVLPATGYQAQLSYQREDGSFSMFGNDDTSGNMWSVIGLWTRVGSN